VRHGKQRLVRGIQGIAQFLTRGSIGSKENIPVSADQCTNGVIRAGGFVVRGDK
jgi:hypothetical protein